MALEVKIVHHEKDSVTIYAAITKVDLLLKTYSATDADAGYPKVAITDSAGVEKLSSTQMTKIAGSTGEYFYTYQLTSPAKGDWVAEVEVAVTVSGAVQKEAEYCHFEVV